MDVQINVGSLPQNGSKVEIRLEKEDIPVKEIIGDALVSFAVYKSGNSYDVEGFIEYGLSLICSRCLKGITQHVRRNFRLEFKEEPGYTVDDKSARETDEAKVEYIVENNCINLGPFLRDEIILSISLKPLCSEECMGLCSICGANLNNTTCEHSKTKQESLT